MATPLARRPDADSLEELLEEAREVVLDPDRKALRRWRERSAGRVVIGHHGSYFPTELCEALGMLHVCDPADDEDCDLVFSGRPRPGAHLLSLPPDPEMAGAAARWGRALAEVGRLLSLAGDRPLAPLYLRAALHVLDDNRRLVRRLLAIRTIDPGRISLAGSFLLRRMASFLPRREHGVRLGAALAAIEARGSQPGPGRRAALFSPGELLPPLEVLEDVERSGLAVVEDDLLLGERMAGIPRPDGSAMEALVETYLEGARPLCAPYNPRRSRAEYVLRRLRLCDAELAVILLPAGAAETALEVARLEHDLRAAGVPHLLYPWQPASQVTASHPACAASGS